MRFMILSLLVACGTSSKDDSKDDDVDAQPISGLYQTDRQSENAGCGGRGEEVIPIPFLRLTQTTDRIEVFECRSETDCNSVGTEDWSFDDAEGEWLGEAHGGSWSDQESGCYLWYQEREFSIEFAAASLARREYDVYDGTIAERDCDEEWPTWNGRGGVCKQEVKISATRIGD